MWPGSLWGELWYKGKPIFESHPPWDSINASSKGPSMLPHFLCFLRKSWSELTLHSSGQRPTFLPNQLSPPEPKRLFFWLPLQHFLGFQCFRLSRWPESVSTIFTRSCTLISCPGNTPLLADWCAEPLSVLTAKNPICWSLVHLRWWRCWLFLFFLHWLKCAEEKSDERHAGNSLFFLFNEYEACWLNKAQCLSLYFLQPKDTYCQRSLDIFKVVADLVPGKNVDVWQNTLWMKNLPNISRTTFLSFLLENGTDIISSDRGWTPSCTALLLVLCVWIDPSRHPWHVYTLRPGSL